MVLFVLEYTILPEKEDDYTQYVKTVLLPYIQTVPGLLELRGYRDYTSGRAHVAMEFDSYSSWGDYMDHPTTKEIMTTSREFTYDVTWKLWGESPITPAPVSPT